MDKTWRDDKTSVTEFPNVFLLLKNLETGGEITF